MPLNDNMLAPLTKHEAYVFQCQYARAHQGICPLAVKDPSFEITSGKRKVNGWSGV